jgi:phytoene dehydrogenase-like protein
LKDYDVIVIGSGIGGLVSAGILASSGLKTLVMEKHVAPGGYLSSFTRKGFTFDSAVDCISGVAPGQLLHRVLEMLGVQSDLRFLRVDPIRVSIFPDFEIAVDADMDTYKERLISLFRAEASSVRSFFDRACNTYSQLQSALNAIISGSFDLDAITAEALHLMGRSYKELLDDYFIDSRLKAVLSDRCPFIGLPPSKVSAVTMINMIMSYFELGAYRPEGGFQKLADVFVKGIRNKGGEAIFGDGVKHILLDRNNLCAGIKSDKGEEYTARHIVSNADFDLTFRALLGGKYAQLADEMMRRPGPSTSFFITYAGIEGSVGRHSSMGWYTSYDMESFFDAAMEFQGDSTIGITIASVEDNTRAPSGFSTMVLHEMATAAGAGADKAACTDKSIQKAERIFPGIKDRIVILDSASPSTLHRYTGNCKGAAFGWRRIPGFGGPKRHGIKNLYIAGHWGDMGGGVLAAAYSGAKAASEILFREGIRSVI